jgi:hypothetical protein
VLLYIKDIISVNYSNSKNENSKDEEEAEEEIEIRNIRLQTRNCKKGSFFHEIIKKITIIQMSMDSVESERVF